ncbi:prepilin peptidase [Vibrio alginolyticus]|uniref:prepilin peptidase n=1 Tax=Vibrio alginolyticus TaxID=663 RepID=UPI0006CA6856|nr:A24 family peptidase [Vibrio alginolyticus]CAH7334302.1 putative DiS_P_DiS domain-containing protein [Vibrio chagasii]
MNTENLIYLLNSFSLPHEFAWILFPVFGITLGSYIGSYTLRAINEAKFEERKYVSETYGLELSNDNPYKDCHRSVCPTCSTQLKWYHNIPILSYLALRGKCHSCKESISIHYPLIETSLLFVWVAGALFNKDPINATSLILLALVSVSIVISIIDLRQMVIFDSHTYLFAFLLALYVFAHPSLTMTLEGALDASIWLIVFVAFTRIYSLIRNHGEPVMGAGDYPLILMLLIAIEATSGLSISSLNAAILKTVLPVYVFTYAALRLFPGIHLEQRNKNEIPFGPSLTIGALMVLTYHAV